MAVTEATRPSSAMECSSLDVCEVPALRSEWYVTTVVAVFQRQAEISPGARSW
jgi:hypothetical protein